MRGAGRVVFAATLLLIVGTLNIIYGIGALDDANIFVNDTRFILSDLNTLGWVLIILGVIQLTGGFSLMAGNAYGRVIGVIGGSLGAIGALLSIGGAYPWWSLGIFVLCVYVVHGILVFDEDEPPRDEPDPRGREPARPGGLPIQRGAPSSRPACGPYRGDRPRPASPFRRERGRAAGSGRCGRRGPRRMSSGSAA